MDNNNYAGQGGTYLVVTFLFGGLGWIWDQIISMSAGEWLKNISIVVSMAAGLMAIRYYYYATKKQK